MIHTCLLGLLAVLSAFLYHLETSIEPSRLSSHGFLRQIFAVREIFLQFPDVLALLLRPERFTRLAIGSLF
jgi:hypothetical protein